MFSTMRWMVALPLVALLLGSSGCMEPPPPPDGVLAIETVAKWFQNYRAENRGKAPANEEKFLEFVEKKLAARGTTLDVDKLMTSPRDGKRYVVQYGKLAAKSLRTPDKNLAVYEQEGYDGKKLIAFEAAYSKEVDEAELQSLLAGDE